MSLRNRKFLRKIEPFVCRYVRIDDEQIKPPSDADKSVNEGDGVEATNDPNSDEVINSNEVIEDSVQRSSTRIRQPPDRYVAK